MYINVLSGIRADIWDKYGGRGVDARCAGRGNNRDGLGWKCRIWESPMKG